MQQLGHSTIDLLKINANDVAVMLKQIFESGIFPRIIIIPSELMKRLIETLTQSQTNYRHSGTLPFERRGLHCMSDPGGPPPDPRF